MNRIKKAVCILGAGAALASAPAFARDGRWEHDRGHRHWNHRQVVVVQRYYVPFAPAYVIERRPVVYSYYPQYYPATGVIVGAAVGAVLGGYVGGRM